MRAGTIEVRRAKGGAVEVNVGDALEALAEVAYVRGWSKAGGLIALGLAMLISFGGLVGMAWRDVHRQRHALLLEVRLQEAETRVRCAEAQFDRVYLSGGDRLAHLTPAGFRYAQQRCLQAEQARRGQR